MSIDLSVLCFVVGSVLSSACILPEAQSRRSDANRVDREGVPADGANNDARGAEGGSDSKASIAGETAPSTSAGAGGTSGPQVTTAAMASDPCAVNNGGCDTSPLAICTSRAGAVISCGCPAGYEGDGRGEEGCEDIDECATANGGCDTMPRATCTNRTGAVPSCSCPGGSSGDGRGSDGCTPNNPVLGPGIEAPCGKFTCTDDVVKDSRTRLTWQRVLPASYDGCMGVYERNPNGSKGDGCTWEEASGYCAQLGLASGGWRLPTKDELLTIVDKSRTDPAIDLASFSNTKSEAFWSASTYTSPPPASLSGAWYVIFRDGTPYNDYTSFVARVRCVR